MLLITGSTGQLGSELKKFYKHGETALFTNSQELDISSWQSLQAFFKKHLKIKTIINCAAYTQVDQAEKEKQLAYQVNFQGTKNLARISKERKIFLVQVSTDYVFDGKNCRPYRELEKNNPVSVYGKSKLLAEKALLKIADSGLIIRTSWLYSEFGKNFVKTVLKLSNEKEKLKIVSDQIGTPTYAYDLAQIIYQISFSRKFEELQQKKLKEIYHFCNEGTASWYDFAHEIIEKVPFSSNFKLKSLEPVLSKDYPTLAQRPYYSVLDNSKIKVNFNLKIRHWKEALKECLLKLSQS